MRCQELSPCGGASSSRGPAGPKGGAVGEEPGAHTHLLPRSQLPALFISDLSPHFWVLVLSPLTPGDASLPEQHLGRCGNSKPHGALVLEAAVAKSPPSRP